MTLQIVLTPSTEQTLSANALRLGMQPAEYAVYLLEQSLHDQAKFFLDNQYFVSNRADATEHSTKPATGVALLEQWLSNNDPEEAAEQAQTFSELQAQLDRNRVHSARKLFTP